MAKPNIPIGLYEKILENVPICCVDLVLHHGKKVLLAYRLNEPAKGQWWIPGGRLLKNETLEHAVVRKAEEEIGIKVTTEKKIGCYEYFSKKAPFGNVKTGIHDIGIVYLVKPSDKNFKIELDHTNSRYRWIDKIEKGLDPYVKRALRDSKVFE